MTHDVFICKINLIIDLDLHHMRFDVIKHDYVALLDNLIKTYLTTAGDWDCVSVVERLHALHYSVDFLFFSFGIMGFIVEL